MPFYNYECQNKKCKHEFDELQKLSDPKLVECPKCHKNTLEKIIASGQSFQFKGDGFYATSKHKRKPRPPQESFD